MATCKPKSQKVETIGPRLLSYEDAARFLGLSTKTLRNWVSLGRYPEIRPKRLGGKPVFDRLVLEKFCDSLSEEGAGNA
jgi:predicted DNA-binding transcriptional regulator AlpA